VVEGFWPPPRIVTVFTPPGIAVYTQPVAGLHESVVQPLLSLQVIAALTQAPVPGVQESVVQALLSLQFLAVPLQMPAEQVSFTVQASPSLQAAVLLLY
jgi:hypothetical protein